MKQLSKCLHFYIGCKTNKGIFSGILKDTLLIQTEKEIIEEYNIQNVGDTLFLYLMQLGDLSTEQSNQLMKEGFSIGRPYGYTFTNHGFLYLLSLGVDLFGLIQAGLAKDIKSADEKDSEFGCERD